MFYPTVNPIEGLLLVIFLVCIFGVISQRSESAHLLDARNPPQKSYGERLEMSMSFKQQSDRPEGLISDDQIEELLKEFWNSAGGPYWTEYRWDFQGPWYQWPGIDIDDDGTYTMDMSANNMTGRFSETFGYLPFSYVGLSYNFLSGTIPHSICQSNTLSSFIVSDNQLEGTIPDCMGNNMNHSWFSVSLGGNQLHGTIPDSLYNSANMNFFSLSGNRISGSISDRIGNWKQLKLLDLSNNTLTGSIPTTINNLVNLTSVYLGYNQLSGNISSETLKGLKITKLILSHNQLEGSLFPFTYLRYISVLNVAHNRFTEPFMQLTFVPRLVYFDFSFNNVTTLIQADQLLIFRIGDISYFNGKGNQLSLESNKLYNYPFKFEGDTQLKTSTENWACKSVSVYDTGLTFLVDPSFFNYSHCTCIRGYYGSPPDHCFPCPVNAEHCSDGIAIEVPRNQYPYPILSLPKDQFNPINSQMTYKSAINNKNHYQNHPSVNSSSARGFKILSSSRWSRFWRAVQGLEDPDFITESLYNSETTTKSSSEILLTSVFEDNSDGKMQQDLQFESHFSTASSSSFFSSSTDMNGNFDNVISNAGPVWFEPCLYDGACSNQCKVKLWIDRATNESHAYWATPSSNISTQNCHCTDGYGGRKCSQCQCDIAKDPKTCYYASSRCRKCKTVWTGHQTAGLFIGIVITSLLIASVVHVIMLRGRRKNRVRSPENESLIKRFFYRLLHVRTIGYFKLFLIWIQTLAAIIDWPTNALHQLWGLLEVANGNPSGIGTTCLWSALRIPLTAYLAKSLIPFAIVFILSLSIFIAHTIWVIFLRPKKFQSYHLIHSEINSDTTRSDNSDSVTKPKSNSDGVIPSWDTSDSDEDLVKGPSVMTDDERKDDSEADNDSVHRDLLANGDHSHLRSEYLVDSLDFRVKSDNYGSNMIVMDSGVRYFSARALLVSELLAVSYFFYFGVTLSSLSSFTCTVQKGTNIPYLQDLPWIRCDGIQARDLRFASIPFLIIITAGVPILFSTLLFHYRNQLEKRTVNDIIGGLYRCYRKKLFWWELVILARRLSLALVLRIEKTSAFHQWSVILILSVSVGLQFLFQPFHQKGENRAEELSLLLLILSFAAQEGSKAATYQAAGLFWLSFVLNCLFMVITLSLLIRSWCTGPVKIDED